LRGAHTSLDLACIHERVPFQDGADALFASAAVST
jgi:hypothetical protein